MTEPQETPFTITRADLPHGITTPPEVHRLDYEKICDPDLIERFTVPVYVACRTIEFEHKWGENTREKTRKNPTTLDQEAFEEAYRNNEFVRYEDHEAAWLRVSKRLDGNADNRVVRRERLRHDARMHIYPVPLAVILFFEQAQGVRESTHNSLKKAIVSSCYRLSDSKDCLRYRSVDDQGFLTEYGDNKVRLPPIDLPMDHRRLVTVVQHLTLVLQRTQKRFIDTLDLNPRFDHHWQEWHHITDSEWEVLNVEQFKTFSPRTFFLSCLECNLMGTLWAFLNHPRLNVERFFLEFTPSSLTEKKPEWQEGRSFFLSLVFDNNVKRRLDSLFELVMHWVVDSMPEDMPVLIGYQGLCASLEKLGSPESELTMAEKHMVSYAKTHSPFFFARLDGIARKRVLLSSHIHH